MTVKRYVVSYTNLGVGVTGLTPTFTSLFLSKDTAFTDVVGSAPTVTEQSDGFYTFDIDYDASPFDDEAAQFVGRLDGGVGTLDERYKVVTFGFADIAIDELVTVGSTLGADIEQLRKFFTNRWEITTAGNMVIYDDDDTTQLLCFELRDADNNLSTENVFKRIPITCPVTV